MKEFTTEEVAKLLGLTTRRVRQLSNPDEETGQTLFERLPSGDYDVYQVVPAYFSYKTDTGPKAEKLAADAEISKIKAKTEEQKFRVSERELIARSVVKQVWRERVSSLRQQCFEWHQRCMDIGDLKPMQREEQDNEFIKYFNEMGKSEH